jgi:hypothetical protein
MGFVVLPRRGNWVLAKIFLFCPLGQNHKNRFFYDKPRRGLKEKKNTTYLLGAFSPVQKVGSQFADRQTSREQEILFTRFRKKWKRKK